MRRERHVVEVREDSNPLPFAKAAGLLEVGHHDVHGAHLEHAPEPVGEIDVLPGADGRAGILGDELEA